MASTEPMPALPAALLAHARPRALAPLLAGALASTTPATPQSARALEGGRCRPCRLRCSLTHVRVRSLRCSPAPWPRPPLRRLSRHEHSKAADAGLAGCAARSRTSACARSAARRRLGLDHPCDASVRTSTRRRPMPALPAALLAHARPRALAPLLAGALASTTPATPQSARALEGGRCRRCRLRWLTTVGGGGSQNR